jgi:protein-tyrosine phosphatase
MNLLNRWFNKHRSAPLGSFAPLQTDIHSHLIPGIDDGPRSMAAAVDLVKKLKELGFRKLVTTPHVMVDLYRNDIARIKSGAEALRTALAEAGTEIELEAAAEYKIDEGLPILLEKGKLLSFGDHYILVELPYYSAPMDLKEQLFALQSAGYTPVLAHPERYVYWHTEFHKLEEIKDLGVLFQLNTISLSGHYSRLTKKTSEKLIDAGMVDFLGSDLHNSQYFGMLEKAMQEPSLKRLMDSGTLRNHLV